MSDINLSSNRHDVAVASQAPGVEEPSMRILHIIASADPRRGGPIEGVRQLADSGRLWGQRTDVATFDGPGQAFLEHQPFRTIALGPSPLKYGYTRALVPWLRAHSREYDAIIVNGLWQYNGFAARRIARQFGVPYCVFPHGMLDPWFKRTYPVKHLKKLAYWSLAERSVLSDARAVFFTCEEERALAENTFPGYRCNGIVIGYGTGGPTQAGAACVDAFRTAYPGLAQHRIWLYLGRIHEKKGCDLAISAFAECARVDPSLHLVVAGPTDTPLYRKLLALGERLGIGPRITFTGMLSGAVKWGALYAAELFVLPSHQENFGIAVVEALACGTPVAVSDKVNIWREIAADGAGLVAPDTLAGTLQMLRQWQALDRAGRALMSERARHCYQKRFEIRGVAARFHATLMGLVGR